MDINGTRGQASPPDLQHILHQTLSSPWCKMFRRMTECEVAHHSSCQSKAETNIERFQSPAATPSGATEVRHVHSLGASPSGGPESQIVPSLALSPSGDPESQDMEKSAASPSGGAEGHNVPSPAASPSGDAEGHCVPSLAVSPGGDPEGQRSAVSPSEGPKKECGRQVGYLLSGIICVNILILACALVSGSAYNHVAIGGVELQIFLLILVIGTTLWMLYYTFYTSREDRAILYKDGHAGPVWLRGGLVLFGICSLLMDIFKIVKYVGYLHCDSAVNIVFPVIQALFIIVQTYFLWVHAKDCVQLQKNLTRCGLMLTLSTNLVLWMAAVTAESVHQTVNPHSNTTSSHATTSSSHTTTPSSHHKMVNRASQSHGDDECKCSHSACGVFENAYYYLYPFNIEYSLFASAMAYVMWKNVGRLMDEHNHVHKHHFSIKDAILGPVAGIVLVLAGLATFVLYEIKVVKEDHGKRDTALMMHYVMNLVAVTLMSLCTVAGFAIYWLEQRDHDIAKNPTRSLDVGLLIGASLGQFVIDYFSIVSVVATGAKDYLSGLSLASSLVTVIQLCLQNYFIIEGLHREPFHHAHQDVHTVFTNPSVEDIEKIGIENLNDLNLNPNNTESDCSLVLTTHDPIGHTAPTLHSSQHRLSWKRRVLKEICAFLLFGNIILWIMPAFGARPQFDHAIGTEFYKFTMWAAVVNIGLPFGIFYRMHAVASLFEVFLNS